MQTRDGGMVAAESADSLPTEFRIFAQGVNESTKGPVTFDAYAAAAVMSNYEREGVDLMIDLEHDSLSESRRAMRSDAADALGWFRLECRSGELWAVDVRWNADGQARLLGKRQRYISPAFCVDSDGRVTSLLNVALVAMPATYRAAPLVAASKSNDAGISPALSKRSKMDPEQIKAALDAIEAGDSAKALEILKALIASAAGAPAEAPEAPAEAMSETADSPSPKPDEVALTKMLTRLVENDATIQRLSSVVASFEARDRAADDAARIELVGELVKLGVELPSTAWSDAGKKIVAARFNIEPVAELRARVDAYRAAGKGVARRDADPTIVTLSQDDADAAAKITDPAHRARFIELRTARAERRNQQS